MEKERPCVYSPFTIYYLLVFWHHFFARAKNLADAALGRNRENLQAVVAPLLQLLLLHLGELRQVARRPLVLHEFERVLFPERMAFPVRRQQDAAQVRVI